MPAFDPRGNTKPIVDPLLSNISVGWTVANQMVGDVLFPAVRVNQQSGKYPVFGRESFAVNHGGDVRAPASQANEIPGVRFSKDTFFASEHALQQTVTPEEREQYADMPRINPDREATENVTSKIVLGRELAIRDMVYDPDNYTSEHVITLGSGETFDDYDDSDPIEVFRDAFRTFHKTLFTVPNVGIIPFEVMSYLEDHPKIVERYVAQGGVMTTDQIASLLGLERVIVPGGAYNASGNPGRSDSIQYIWDRHIVLAWVPPRAGWKVPAFGYEFVWPINGRTMATDRWYDVDRITDVVRVRRRYDLKFVAKEDMDDPNSKSIAGMLIRNGISA